MDWKRTFYLSVCKINYKGMWSFKKKQQLCNKPWELITFISQFKKVSLCSGQAIKSVNLKTRGNFPDSLFTIHFMPGRWGLQFPVIINALICERDKNFHLLDKYNWPLVHKNKLFCFHDKVHIRSCHAQTKKRIETWFDLFYGNQCPCLIKLR